MRKIILTALIITFLRLGASARTVIELGVYYEVNDDTYEAEVISNPEKYSGRVYISEKVGRYTVTSIGNNAFEDCSDLEYVYIPNTVTTIGDYAFCLCGISLTSINIPKSVVSIGKYAFYGCTSLTEIDIPESVTSIGDYAFGDCNNISTITFFSNNNFSLGNNVFIYDVSLTDIYCYATQVPITQSSTFEGIEIGSITLHVPIPLIDDYASTAPWSSFSSILPIAGTSVEAYLYDRTTNERCFTISGLHIFNTHKGIQIVVRDDGSRYKVIKK